MKDITFAVPCYNSQAYMKKCIESLLLGGERVEIIIVNDGSSDKTGEIADSYAEKYPGIVKAVHQENRGHGGAINHAIKLATGRYFKVIDSDDWAAQKAYARLLQTMDKFNEEEHYPDMVVVNYVYDKVGVKRKRRMKYDNCLPEEKYFGWDEFGHTNMHQYLLMHAVIIKTSILQENNIVLPEHMFYVDNVFVFNSLPYVYEMYYLNVDFYRYFIGRQDQSVNEKVMIGRIDQQHTVTKMLIDSYSFEGPENRALYMRKYLRIMMEVSSILCIISYDEELIEKKKQLWKYVKEKNRRLYRLLRYHLMGWTCHVPTKLGWRITKFGYRIANKIYGFN
ncbi:MAG: glycosyltransferase family 2 protein [Lachnospiraceae bacterium]|nr:glycosyltransferase family 2 protein [Lachnospiraceae bacterium]